MAVTRGSERGPPPHPILPPRLHRAPFITPRRAPQAEAEIVHCPASRGFRIAAHPVQPDTHTERHPPHLHVRHRGALPDAEPAQGAPQGRAAAARRVVGAALDGQGERARGRGVRVREREFCVLGPGRGRGGTVRGGGHRAFGGGGCEAEGAGDGRPRIRDGSAGVSVAFVWVLRCVPLTEDGRDTRLQGDLIILGRTPPLSNEESLPMDLPSSGLPRETLLARYAFSQALSRSTALSGLETSLERYLSSVSLLPQALQKTGKPGLGRRALVMKLGELLRFRQGLNLNRENFSDTPDFYWSEPVLEGTCMYRSTAFTSLTGDG